MPTQRPILGVLGGGQLGRMLALAAYRLDIQTRLFDPDPSACAGQVAPLTSAPWHDLETVRRWAAGCDAVTFEFENVPLETARAVARVAPLRPGVESLESAQDRALERALFDRLGIPTPAWAAADTPEALESAARSFPLPALVKARRGGYDGKGQARLQHPDEAPRVFASLGSVPVILDQIIPFERELSIVLASSGTRSVALPPAENLHHRGILVRSIAPAPALDPRSNPAALDALAAASRLADALRHHGVLALEFFDDGSGRWLANEFAPRVHNTGHWSMDAAPCGQFELHVRAVMGLPLPSAQGPGWLPAARTAVMANLIGRPPPADALLRSPGRVHLYGKTDRPGRKIGHVNLLADELASELAPDQHDSQAHPTPGLSTAIRLAAELTAHNEYA